MSYHYHILKGIFITESHTTKSILQPRNPPFEPCENHVHGTYPQQGHPRRGTRGPHPFRRCKKPFLFGLGVGVEPVGLVRGKRMRVPSHYLRYEAKEKTKN
jgi:hypothetical protein